MARPRFVSVSRINGWSIAIVCGLSLLLSLGSLGGMLISAAALVSPVLELKGSYAAERGDASRLKFLPMSQLILLAVILLYSIARLVTFDPAAALADMSGDLRSALADAAGGEQGLLDVTALSAKVVYLTLIVVSLLYQGGLFFYYRRAVRDFQPQPATA
jgi:hypothetical protein